jgi:hypothetical protein
MQKLMFACAHYAALAVFVCGCWGWGRAVMARLSPPVGRDAWLEAVMAVALGLGLFICAFQALAMVGVFRLGATVGLVGLGVAAAVLQFAPWRREVKALRAHAVRVAWTQSDKLAMAALALVALPALVEPLAPPVAFDEVMYHLPYARQVALEGSLGIYDWLRYPWFPYNYNLLYAAALQVGDDVFPHLLSALAGGLSALMVYRLCIQHADRLTACVGTAIWLGLGDYRSAMIDMGVALLLLTACVAILWWRQARPAGTGGHWLGLAAFFLGLAAGSKYQALVYLPLVAVFVAWHERRISAWASALVLFLLPSGYWYARNAILTGDPFNPIGGPVFGFTDWNPADHAVQIADVRVRAEMPNRLLWAVLLAPFSAAWKRSGVVRAAGWFCLYAVLVWTVTSRYPRYLMAVFPLLAIMAALGWQVLFCWLAAGVRRMAERGDRGWRAPASGHEPRRVGVGVGVGVGVWLAMALLPASTPTSPRRRRRVAAAAAAHDAVDHHHAHARDVAQLHALEQALAAGECWARSMKTKSASRPTSISPQLSLRIFAVLPVAKQNTSSAGMFGDGRQHRDHAQDAQRLHARAGRPVGAQDHAVRALELQRGLGRRNGHLLVAVVHDLDGARTLLAQLAHVRLGQRGVAAVDVADDVGVGLQHHVLVDQARARDRGAAGVDGALDAVLARPRDHLLGLVAGLHRAQADFAQQAHAGFGQFLEVALDHALLDDGRTGQHLHAAGAEVVEGALRGDGQRLQADDVLGPAGQVHLAGGDHGGDAAVHGGVDPADLALARRPVAEHRVHVAVDQARARRRSSRSR